MESFAIWYEGTPNIEAKLNVNIWKCNHKNSKYSIDIGLLIYDCKKVNDVYIHIPRIIKNENIIDLGKIMIEHDHLCRAIFNSKIVFLQSRPDHERIEKNINIVDSNINVMLLSFKDSSHYLRTEYEGATILKIPIKELVHREADNAYFRFRITELDSTLLSYEEPSKFWFIQSAVTCVETIEFRLNDHRLFSRYVIEKLETNNQFKLKSYHVFIMRDATDELIDEEELRDIRLLEKEIWNPYTVGIKVAEKTIAYHFKKDNIDDVSLFCRIKYPSFRWKFIFGYLGIVIILAILANLLTPQCFNLVELLFN